MSPEQSTGPDLTRLMRAQFAADNDQDLDAVIGFYAPGAVWDLSDLGLGVFEGAAAIRTLVQDWWATWEYHRTDAEEVLDLGNGIAYAAIRENCRVIGSDRHVEQRRGWVVVWEHDRIARVTVYLHVEDARAAAERASCNRV